MVTDVMASVQSGATRVGRLGLYLLSIFWDDMQSPIDVLGG